MKYAAEVELAGIPDPIYNIFDKYIPVITYNVFGFFDSDVGQIISKRTVCICTEQFA